MRLIDELNELHDDYASKIEAAIGRDDVDTAEQLAQGYEDDAIQLMAEREGLTHLLPLKRAVSHESSLHRLARRLRPSRAARSLGAGRSPTPVCSSGDVGRAALPHVSSRGEVQVQQHPLMEQRRPKV
jgi:hypothetical protein